MNNEPHEGLNAHLSVSVNRLPNHLRGTIRPDNVVLGSFRLFGQSTLQQNHVRST
jgi:hypothetical protein